MIWSPTTRCLPLVFAILTIPLAPGTDARMFRANLEHTGTYAGPALQRFGRVKWKFHTNGRVISSPAVVSGLVYIGSTDGKLYAIDAGSGKQKWAFEAKARITSSPAVEGGAVYFESYDGNFYAVDAVSGQLRWKFQTAGERRFAGKNIHGILPAGEIMPDPFDSFLSSPAVWKGVVYFGSGDGSIYALDATSGSLKWKFPTGDVVHASPAVSNGMVFIGSWDRYMYALDASSGKEKWRFKTGEDRVIYNQVGIQSSASVVDGIVYFGCRDSNLYALNAVTGEKNWIFNNNGNWVITTPAVKGDTIYFATSDSALFYALDRRSGAVRFSLNMKWPMFSSPAVVDNMVYIGSREGKLFAIDVATQKVSWEFQSDTSRHNAAAFSKSDGSPNYGAVVNENFYDSIMVSLDKLEVVGPILSSPVVVDSVIYFGSDDGNVYAIM